MGITAVLFWILIVAVVVALLGWARPGGGRPADSARREGPPDVQAHDAYQVLDTRFARGEIEAEEYNIRRRVLQENR